MIPGPWQFVLLALSAYRLTRLVGWDDLPPILHARAWLLGWDPELGACKRRLLTELFSCAFCLGFWISLAVYGCWLAFPTETLYAAVLLALSAVVGLIAKNLDA